MALRIPTQSEISAAVQKVFSDTLTAYGADILNALVAVDNDLLPGHPSINYIVDAEVQEVCELANDLNASAKREGNSDLQKARARLVVYCHIMEAHLPQIVFWNLLRMVAHEPCSWTFYTITKTGKQKVCIYPKDKIAEIARLSQSTNQPIGQILADLWKLDLRNCFSHSQYVIDNGQLLGTGSLSPISRRDKDPLSRAIRYSFEEIDQLAAGANCLLSTFIEAYRSTIGPFKDGKPYRIHAGLIEWHSRGTWIWSRVDSNQRGG